MAAATEMLVGGVVLALASALGGERPQAWPTLEGSAGAGLSGGVLVRRRRFRPISIFETRAPGAGHQLCLCEPGGGGGAGGGVSGERIGAAEWLAMAVIVLAVVWISLPRRAA